MGCGCGGSTQQFPQAGSKAREVIERGPASPGYFWDGPERKAVGEPKPAEAEQTPKQS